MSEKHEKKLVRHSLIWGPDGRTIMVEDPEGDIFIDVNRKPQPGGELRCYVGPVEPGLRPDNQKPD